MGFRGGPSKGYPANLVQGSHGGRSENKLLEVNRSVYRLQEEYAGPYQGLGNGPHCAPHFFPKMEARGARFSQIYEGFPKLGGYRDFNPIMENQMEKKMDNEMETEGI